MFSGQIHSRQPDGRRHLGGRRGWERCGFAAHLRDYPEHGAAAVPDAHLSHPLLSLAGARWTGRTGRDGTGREGHEKQRCTAGFIASYGCTLVHFIEVGIVHQSNWVLLTHLQFGYEIGRTPNLERNHGKLRGGLSPTVAKPMP